MAGIDFMQNRRLHGLLKATGLEDRKAELVYSFTSGRSSSSKDLTVAELRELIAYLERQKQGVGEAMPLPTSAPETEKGVADKMRKKIFSLCYTMGYIYGDKPEDKKMNQAVVLRLVQNKGYLKPKGINDYAFNELPKLVTQFESMKRNNDYQAARVAAREIIKEIENEQD